MAITQPNPRRRPSSSDTGVPTLSSTSKAATFHQPRSPASAADPTLNITSLIHRAPTSTKDELEALVENNETRVQEFLNSIEDSLRGLQKISLTDPADKETTALAAETQRKLKNHFALPARVTEKNHASDSGLGSSESSESEHDKKGLKEGTSLTVCSKDSDSHHASAAADAPEGAKDKAMEAKPAAEHDAQRVLSEYACKQIQKHIINPILAQEHLKPFHPLVKHLPFRIADKKITTLRDLERVIFWLAPKYSITAKAFWKFSQATIQCIYATVPHLNTREQVRPHQQPYTNRYFLDLTEQVRQFAQMISRQRDATTGKTVQLAGGLSQSGKPAELTYVKDGKLYSLRTGEEMDPNSLPLLKRTVGEDLDDDVERSMARRKKNAPPEKTVQKCSDCGKEFKRPCDLTKHEKTHSRPWKCHEKSCKYFEYGWPTEKERDRHFNDKHSNDPKMFRCDFAPCPYESKRESNCKQHMEKAHGWNYSRTKSNGKAPKRPSYGQAPPTPSVSSIGTPGSHIFAAPSPAYTAASPATMGSDTPLLDFAQPPVYQAPQLVGPSYNSPAQNQIPPVPQFDFNTTFGPLNSAFQFSNEDPLDLNNLDTLNNMVNSPGSWDSAFGNADTDMKDEESIFGNNFDWANQDLTSMNLQMLSPTTVSDASIATPAQLPEWSPAQSKTMMPTPLSQCLDSPAEDGFADFAQTSKDMDAGGDFALFGKDHGYDANSAPLFGDISSEQNFSHMRM